MTHETKTRKSKERVLEELIKSRGIVTNACNLANVSRAMFYKWKEDDPEFLRAVEDVEDIALDFVESALHRQINDGNPASTIFYLKTKGKRRGYIEKQQIEHSGEIAGAPVITFSDTTKKE